MEIGVAQCVNKGMQRDYSMSKASQEFAYENMNIRIVSNGNNSFLSVSNERSTTPLDYTDITIKGVVLGSAEIDSKLILFTRDKSTDTDYIYKCDIENNNVNVEILFSDKLGFDINNPIECLVDYESKDIQKVYWVDGINQPRVINVVGEIKDNVTQFDFVPTISKDLNVEINKQFLGIGEFPSGTIQYIVTYYNKYSQESNIVYLSPLYYLSHKNRGGSAEEINNCNFEIILNNLDTSFDYVKVYSLHRTSQNASPVGYLVADYKIKNDESLHIIDKGGIQPTVDITSLIFSSSEIYPQTITSKDNVLFLGNIKTKDINKDLFTKLNTLFSSIRNEDGLITNENVLKFDLVERFTEVTDVEEYYQYSNQLDKGSDKIKFFKFGEVYRIGIQFQSDTKNWTQTIWLGDVENTCKVCAEEDTEGNTVYKYPTLIFNPSALENFESTLSEYGYSTYRILMVEPTFSDRKVLAQGYVTPTIYNVRERHNNTCYSAPSWFPRFINKDFHRQNVNKYYSTEADLKEVLNNEIDSDNNSLEYNYLNSEKQEISLSNQKFTFVCTHKKYTLTRTRENNNRDYKIKISYLFDLYDNVGDLVAEEIYMVIASKDFNYGPAINMNSYSKISGHMRDWLNKPLIEIDPDIEQNLQILLKTFLIKFLDDSWTGQEFVIVGIDYSKKAFTDSQIDITKSLLKNNHERLDTFPHAKTFVNSEITDFDTAIESAIKDNENNYFIDASTLTFHSPDLENVINYDLSDLKFRIVGVTNLESVISDYKIDIENNNNSEVFNFNFNKRSYNFDSLGLKTFPLIHNALEDNTNKDTAFFVSPWNKSLTLTYRDDTSDITKNTLKAKIIGNLWYCNTDYNILENGIKYLKYSDNVFMHMKSVYEGTPMVQLNDFKLHKSEYENVLAATGVDKPLITRRLDNVVLGANIESLTSKIIENEDFYQTDSPLGADVNIKYKSTPHIVISLNSVDNAEVILPNYSNNKNAVNNSDITNGSIIGDVVPVDAHLEAMDNMDTSILDSQEFNLNMVTTGTLKNKYSVGDIIIICATTEQIISTNSSYISIKNRWLNYVTDEINTFASRMGGLTNYLASEAKDDSQIGSKVIKDNIYYIVGKIKGVNAGDGWIAGSTGTLIIDKLDIFTPPGSSNGIIDMRSALYKLTQYIDSTNFNYLNKLPFEVVSKSVISTNSNFYTVSLLEKTALNTSIWNGSTSITDNIKSIEKPALWVCEIYRDLPNPYGGNSENAIENNTFIPIGEPTKLTDISYNTEGDTYFQRWDSLKTYPYGEGDINSIVDVVSLMLETHTNIDGRSDNNRGRQDIRNIRPNNINIINTAYTQTNNIFSSSVLDDKFVNTDYSNYYTWSLKKIATSDIDNWTKGLMINVESLNGSYGKLTKLELWNDYLLAFQDKGIARINFNNQSVISTTQGVPIEIANSGKVNGHTYLTTATGCQNKWSVTKSPYGLYFIDGYNKTINVFNEAITPLSDVNLFKDWINTNEHNSNWLPINTEKGFKSFYDSINKDVYFVNGDYCLGYNELLKQFTSFYNYETLNTLIGINGHVYGINSDANPKIYKMFEGIDYCNLFDNNYDYYMTYKLNDSPFKDKVWTNVEYRADVFESGNIQNNPNVITKETFDVLRVENEYQLGEVKINSTRHCYPNKEKKFRIWRLDIPRDSNSKHKLDRIRNPWIVLTLKKDSNTNKRMEFHDLLVKYLS